MFKKRSKLDVLDAGICPDCGGRLRFKNIIEKKRLESEGYKPIGHGVFQKDHIPHDRVEKTHLTAQDKVEVKEKKRFYDRQRNQGLKLAEEKRARRNLKRSESLKRGGV